MQPVQSDDSANLIKQLFSNPDSIGDFTADDIAKIKSQLSPAGDIKGAKESFAAISVMNLTEKYQRRLIVTSMVGFLYRLLNEYEAPDETKKDIRKFLDRNFNFDPDRHVRVAHTDPAGDPERKTRAQLIKDRCANNVEKKLESKQDAVFKYLKDTLQALESAASESHAATNSALNTVVTSLAPTTSAAALTSQLEDSVPILYRSRAKLAEIRADLLKVTAPLSKAATRDGLDVVQPDEVFYNFARYSENNYESLREITTSFYAEKPDVEFAIQYYDTFKSEEQAKDFCDQHNNEFKSAAFVVSNKSMTLLGPWKQNRDRVVYYDKNKELLSGIIAQQERDAKFGMDVMKKAVSRAKKKNINEAGLDAPGLSTYTNAMQIVKELSGAERVLSDEDKKKLVEAKETARKVKEDYEVPDDAIQVDVFKPNVDGTALTRQILYTAAEKPLHMQPDDPHAAQYQPIRAPGVSVDEAYTVERDKNSGFVRHVVDKSASSAYSDS